MKKYHRPYYKGGEAILPLLLYNITLTTNPLKSTMPTFTLLHFLLPYFIFPLFPRFPRDIKKSLITNGGN